jgi:hypothetical protein
MSNTITALPAVSIGTPALSPAKPAPISRKHRKAPLYAIPIALGLAILIALMITLVVLGRKGKLKKLSPYQNPYLQRLKREAQIDRVARVELERRNADLGASAKGAGARKKDGVRSEGGRGIEDAPELVTGARKENRERGVRETDAPELVR